MPLLLAASAAMAPTFFAPATLAASFGPAGADLPRVEAAARVTPATSSMNWTRMCWLEKRTLMRGRSLVPVTVLRMRQCRSVASWIFLSDLMFSRPRIWPGPKGLLHSLAFLAPHFLVGVADSLALVRFGRVEAADFSRDLADHLLAGAFDGDLGVFLNRDLDLVWDRIIDGMGIAEGEVDVAALDDGLEADALDFELFDKAFADSLDHVIDDGAAQAVQGPGLGVLALAADDDAAAVEAGGGAA